ncbi:3363_t:CDS:2, partial [Acaulospora colombiana]
NRRDLCDCTSTVILDISFCLTTRHEDGELIDVLVKSKKTRSLEIYDRAKRFYEDHRDFIEKLDDGELR